MKQKLYNYLSSFITENRKELIETKILDRTNYLTVVLEDIYQSQNASAVLRTSDCFGIQTVHVVENKNQYKINPDVALGAANWIDLFKYNSSENNTLDVITKLKNEGYRIVATVPNHKAVSLEEFDLAKGKVALFFGTELEGLSEVMINNADEFLKINMFGFTESFNISVSAGIILHQLSGKLRQSNINWQLSEDENINIKLAWVRRSLKKSEMIEKEFFKKNQI
ncbi:MAG TPA: TrmH family RNA methyltransferase [Bacteroidales bacterium]|nr:MAG: hypothetical protein A2W98_10330 [Bacteroidetes bacterium GWF2_33_38]OFY73021.1 MAG: hypothetical protein A2265_04885 [Bacteroidetes bacterium RIFOXYA12_FULL_33_9]OFY85427.1 MAG: hypothetical protein A2236_01525 [Bacteroidetes bacterium RIFOXYA2_FULL_33_7]HBF89346.1 TrmH family RNA methyltransferase [Bacteroidales bacterium]